MPEGSSQKGLCPHTPWNRSSLPGTVGCLQLLNLMETHRPWLGSGLELQLHHLLAVYTWARDMASAV